MRQPPFSNSIPDVYCARVVSGRGVVALPLLLIVIYHITMKTTLNI